MKLETLNQLISNTLAGHLGIEFTQITPDRLTARMPVDERTCQVVGMLHGGASAALAETVGSAAAILSVDPETQFALGLDLKCNHVRPALRGTWVYASAQAIHLGKRTQLWSIEIKNEAGAMVCFSTHTVAVMDHTPESRAFVEGLLG